jgi:hypothetical protein
MLTAMESPVRILVGAAHALAPGRWRVTFRVTNLREGPIVIEDAWIPHGRFRGEGRTRLGLAIEPGAIASLRLAVSSDEPVGTTVHNAFLILRIRSGDEAGWRVFTRMRIEFQDDGMYPIVEAITANTLSGDANVA